MLTLVLSSLLRIQSESHHELVNRFRGGRFLYQSFSLPYASDKIIVDLSMNQKLLAKMNPRILVGWGISEKVTITRTYCIKVPR